MTYCLAGSSDDGSLVDECPECGYIGAMGVTLVNPETGVLAMLRCHACGTDREVRNA